MTLLPDDVVIDKVCLALLGLRVGQTCRIEHWLPVQQPQAVVCVARQVRAWFKLLAGADQQLTGRAGSNWRIAHRSSRRD